MPRCFGMKLMCVVVRIKTKEEELGLLIGGTRKASVIN